MVGGRSATGLDADAAAVRLHLLDDLREVYADIVVLGADIGGAQIGILRQEITVPGEYGNAGILGRLKC